MQAIVLKKPGSSDNFIIEEVPDPSVKDSELLVQVKAISVNPVDAAARANPRSLLNITGINIDNNQVILGWDISGIVKSVGSLVAGFKAGDEVFGMVNFPGYGQAYAEFVAAPESHLALKPEKISFEEAAGATLAALTAWQALITHGKLQSGEKVLIHAAAGGVGHFAVPIAKSLGAYVIGTSSAKKRDFVLSSGADEHVDYESTRFEDAVHDVDLVIDCINRTHDNIERSLLTLKQGGRLISLKSFFDDAFKEKLKNKNVFGHRMMVESNGQQMNGIAQLLKEGIIKTHIFHTYSFNEMPQAHRQIETGKTTGKVIVRV